MKVIHKIGKSKSHPRAAQRHRAAVDPLGRSDHAGRCAELLLVGPVNVSRAASQVQPFMRPQSFIKGCTFYRLICSDLITIVRYDIRFFRKPPDLFTSCKKKKRELVAWLRRVPTSIGCGYRIPAMNIRLSFPNLLFDPFVCHCILRMIIIIVCAFEQNKLRFGQFVNSISNYITTTFIFVAYRQCVTGNRVTKLP